ncbi:hypothetical protein [Prolixibacter bellariivorans]|uniref:hypothetical protein n=1 Tax=Prolixibacter bellariivorans TaxID=314319 RepID=UPI00131EE059|nr:hypothetical protein [Prolixibacter bellariivorans]
MGILKLPQVVPVPDWDLQEIPDAMELLNTTSVNRSDQMTAKPLVLLLWKVY